MFAKLGVMNPWKFYERIKRVLFMIHLQNISTIVFQKGIYVWIYSRTYRIFISGLETSHQKLGMTWWWKPCLHIMAVQAVKFSSGVYKIGKICA